MRILERALKITFILIFLLFFHIGTITYMPCVVYPSAYFQAREIGEKIRDFQSKHMRLPDFSSTIDVAELGLNAGYGISPTDRNDSYKIYIWPDTEDDLTYAVDQKLAPEFDGPLVAYDPIAESIACGHR